MNKLFLYSFIILMTSLYAQDFKIDNFFRMNDHNRDGKITKDELTDSDAFQILDKNNDGVITRNELNPNADGSDTPKEKVQKNRQGLKMLARFDTNFDGKISQDEWEGPQEGFSRLDKNGDGFIEKNEIQDADLRKRDFKDKKDAFGNEGFGEGPRGDKEHKGRREKFLDGLDQNGDGKISKSEWKGPEKAFAHLDKNSDGFIDSNEFPKRGEGKKPGENNERGKIHQMFRFMDKNKDGSVTKDEWFGSPEVFERLDKNKDGRLNQEDRPEDGGEPMQKLKQAIKKMDTNRDGKISSEEWSGNEEIFSRLDKNGDNVIDKEEMKFGREGHRPNGKFQEGRKRREEDGRGRRNGRFREMMREKLEKLDANGDGEISSDEWPHDMEKFNFLDKNQDGVISEEDRK